MRGVGERIEYRLADKSFAEQTEPAAVEYIIYKLRENGSLR